MTLVERRVFPPGPGDCSTEQGGEVGPGSLVWGRAVTGE